MESYILRKTETKQHNDDDGECLACIISSPRWHIDIYGDGRERIEEIYVNAVRYVRARE